MPKASRHSNQSVDYQIRVATFASGERFPFLFDCEKQQPEFRTTLFIISQLRNASNASNTIEQALRGASLILLLEKRLGLDLSARMREGRLLNVYEIDQLSQLAGLPFRSIAPSAAPNRHNPSTLRGVHITPQFVSSKESSKQVDANTKALRLHYAGVFLSWLARKEHQQINDQATAASLTAQMRDTLIAIKVRTPPVRQKHREAIPPNERTRLISVVDENSPENPWSDPFLRIRNRLIVLWGIGCGLRRGELLAMTLKKVELQHKRATIIRNPDNKKDPRAYPPLVKTRGRSIPLGADLASLTLRYIQERARIPESRRHGYLFVSKSGRPLSSSAITKIFRDIRTRAPGLSQSLSMHVLRHVWNEEFSDRADRIGLSPEEEVRIRNEAMGWSDRSQTAAKYQTRRTRAKAAEFSMELQESFFKKPLKFHES